MPGGSLTRRNVLALLSSAPVAARAAMQTTVAPARRLASDGHRILLRETDGTVLAWRQSGMGFNGVSFGLGHNDVVPRFVAYAIPGLSNVTDVAVGGHGGYALLADGHVLAWGVNARGGVGNTPLSEFEAKAAPRGNALAPTPVVGVADVVGISANGTHALAVTKGGAVYAWGENIDHQLGLGQWPIIAYKTRSAQPTNYMPYPVRIPGLSDVAAVAAGSQHSLALMRDGTVRAWGSNRRGQVGDGTVTNRQSPVVVTGVKNAVAVAASVWVSAALLADGTVMTWGHGTGALGRTPLKPGAPYATASPVAGVVGIRALALGEAHALALTNAGTVISWGDDTHGKVGHRKPVPAPIEGLTGVQSIAIGGASSFAIDATGRIMIWGATPRWARVDGESPDLSRTPIPLVIKGLKNL